jgi:hypothetical protein
MDNRGIHPQRFRDDGLCQSGGLAADGGQRLGDEASAFDDFTELVGPQAASLQLLSMLLAYPFFGHGRDLSPTG